MKTIILCGGKGTRMDKLSESIPKPLALIGKKPVLWHIMKIYASFGFNEFVLCLGYKGEKIVEYFEENPQKEFEIQFLKTGEEATKSQRLQKAKSLVGERFFLAYGDDLADIDLKALLAFHEKRKTAGTVTAVHIESPFGVMKIGKAGLVEDFKEKPVLNQLTNGGFMVFEKKIFDYLHLGELETQVFSCLVKEKQLSAFIHNGKWKTMNTLKDNIELNGLWKNKEAFWKVWQ